jgi:CelD/BcsL family acetyltransferase involved in cellulose biosynthesis
MSLTAVPTSFDELASQWHSVRHPMKWSCVFVLPPWLRAWWQVFGADSDLYLHSIWEGQRVVGIAPLLLKEGTAQFIGDSDVCDYQDFVVAPGQEPEFFDLLLDHLCRQGVSSMDLGLLRPESVALTHLVPAAKRRGHEVSSEAQDVTLEMNLPRTWEEYLLTLSAKQRHEVRRKLRKLRQAADVDYLVLDDVSSIDRAIDVFFDLFGQARLEKAHFMTPEMERFFQSMTANMADAGILKLCVLNANSRPVASIVCFDYDKTFHLYNSSYDPGFDHLSVGIVCKVLSVKHAIENGMEKYDFLKGEEPYKGRLGGKRIPLYRCRILLT